MSRQSLLDTYFKLSKVNALPSIAKSRMNDRVEDKVAKKRSLSLKKPVTPCKSPRIIFEVKPEIDEVVDLCSDEESVHSSSPAQMLITPKVENGIVIENSPATSMNALALSTPLKSGYESDSSEATVIYSPPTTPQTPKRSPKTPKHSPQTPVSSFQSPSPGKKYFSPTKKRAVSVKKPVRRVLLQNLDICENNELYNNACIGLDDKTIFLLTIINKYICNPLLYRLLDDNAQRLLSKTMHVAKPGMRLVCRLYWHKEGWYKLDKIKSLLSEINQSIDDPTLQLVLNSLQESGFLTLGDSEGNAITFDEFTSILSAVDLKELCQELKLKFKSKKDAIDSLKKFSTTKSINNFFTSKTSDNSVRVLKIMSKKAGPCYKLSDLARKTLHDLYILMYLGINYNVIREKNLELMLLYDKIGRETYPVDEDMLDDASIVFRERQEFKSYVDAHNIHEEYLEETDTQKRCAIVTKTFDSFNNISNSEMLRTKSLPVWLRRFTPLHMYVKILESGVQELKKLCRYGTALEILDALILQDMCRQHRKAEWYAEKALVLHKCSKSEEAAKTLLDGFKTNMSEEAKDTMRPRAKLFAKQKNLGLEEHVRAELLEYANKDDIMESNLPGVHVYKQPMDRTKQKGKLKFETRVSDGMIVQDVEEYCLSHYLNSGEFTDGMHGEGKIVTTIFFLLFWDVIYWRPPDCPGVFLCRFQKYPLDLFCESFYANRRQAIEARLALIERSTPDEIVEMLQARWQERPEAEQSGGVSGGVWGGVLRAAAAGAARGAGRALCALCRRLAADYRYAHSGFPDLTLWNTDTNKVKFVEVKSDTDKPSMKQLQWLRYLRQNGLEAEFCYVGANTKRCKARPV